MTKRIILTTMSILPKNPIKNFYQSDNQKYCEGISQLEAGTKYYLSTVENIKEIVAIGSNEVIDREKDILSKVSLKDQFKNRNVVQELVSKQEPSAYSMYSYGVRCFLNEEEEPSTIQLGEKRIDEIRQKQLNQIIEEHQADSLDKRMNDINEAIKEDIEKAYLSKEEKEAYRLGKEIDINKEETIDPYITSVKKERSLSLFGKEIIFVRLFDEIQNKVLDMSSKKETVSLEDVKKYQDDLQKLTLELEDIRNNRLSTEKQYAKEKIFEDLDSNSKLKCREENKKVNLQFVPLKKENEIDNIQGLLNSIQEEKEEIEIYLDMQGGSRTDGYIRSAVLSLLNNDEATKVKLKKVIACDFEQKKFFNPIKNETKRYKITDLVSGMNAFINYGKAEQLNQTWKELTDDNPEDEVQNIINLMRKVDQSLSLCDVDALAEGIRQLDYTLTNPITVTNSNEEFMEVLRTNILEDYRGIVKNGKIDIFALVKWANKKGFIQQAITLIESRMPEQMIKDGYLSYCPNLESKEKVLRILDGLNKKGTVQDWKLDNIDHVMVQQAAHGFKSVKGKAKVPNYIFLYEQNTRIIEDYARIWSRRNEANHAGNNAMSYKETVKLIKKFIQSYNNFRNRIKKKNDPLSCVHLFRKDLTAYRRQETINKNAKEEKKAKTNKTQQTKEEAQGLYDRYVILQENKSPVIRHRTDKYGKSKAVHNEKLKKLAREFEDSVLKLLNLNRQDISNGRVKRIYNDQNKEYLNTLKIDAESLIKKDQVGCFLIPKVMYNKNKKFYETEVINKNHKLILIDTKSNPMKIIE